MKKIISLFLVLAMCMTLLPGVVLANNSATFEDATDITSAGITLNFSENLATDQVLKVGGTAVDTSTGVDGTYKIKKDFELDKVYTVELDGVLVYAFKLDTIYADNTPFSVSSANPKTITEVDGDNYVLEVDINRSTSSGGRLEVYKYTNGATYTGGMGYAVRNYSTAYTAYIAAGKAIEYHGPYDIDVTSGTNIDNISAGGYKGTNIDSNGFMNFYSNQISVYLGRDCPWASGAKCIFYESNGVNNLILNGENVVYGDVVQSSTTHRTSGNIVLRAQNATAVEIDSVKVYKVSDIDVSTYPVIGSVTLVKEDDNYVATVTGSNIEQSEYKWESKDIGDDDNAYQVISGETGLNLACSTELEDKIIRFTVTPKNNSGVEGSAESVVYVPAVAPTASNVIITGAAVVGETLEAKFDFMDSNGDAAGDHIYTWYQADTPDALDPDYVEITSVTGDATYVITEDNIGKYIKVGVVPVSENEPCEGLEVFSSSYVYVSPVLVVNSVEYYYNNLYFEFPGEVSENLNVQLNGTDVTYTTSGNTLVLSNPTLVEDNLIYISAGRQYVYISLSVETLLSDDFSTDTSSVWNGATIDTTTGIMTIPTNTTVTPTIDTTKDWSNYYLEYSVTNTSFNYRLFTKFGSAKEVTASSREYWESSSGILGIYPSNVSISTDMMAKRDKTGFDKYLADAERIAPAVYTVYCGASNQKMYQNGELRLDKTNTLSAGGFEFKVDMALSDVPVKFDYVKAYKIDWMTADSVPEVSNVKLNGVVYPGQQVNLTYDYSHTSNKAEGTHKIEWYISDTEDGKYEKISGENTTTLNITDDLANKFIKASILPFDNTGVFGASVFSQIVTKAQAPVVKDGVVKVIGNAGPGATVTADYVYYDANGDKETGSVIEWYICDNENDAGTLIDGATEKTFTLTDDMSGKYIKTKVTPKSDTIPTDGITYESEPVYVYYRPTLENVQLERVGTNVTVKYDFVSVDNRIEGATRYEWTVNGVVTTTKNPSIVINTNVYNTISVKVTPVIADLELEGTVYSVSAQYTAIGTSSGGGLGGGGNTGGNKGQGSTTQTIEEIIDVEIPVAELETFADLKTHWCAEYANRVCEEGIMDVSDKENFWPELTITRADFAVMLLKAIGGSEESYSAEFTDVSSDDYFAGAVQALINMGVISNDIQFNPYEAITREQVCKMVMIALNIEMSEESGELYFTDSDEISDWAKAYVSAAMSENIMEGTGDNAFSPKQFINRAQAAALAVKILDRQE